MNNKNIHICHSLEEGGITTFVRSLVQLNDSNVINHEILLWNKSSKGDHIFDISKSDDKSKLFDNIVNEYDVIYVHSLKPFMLKALYKRKKDVYLFQHGLTLGSGFRKVFKQYFYAFVINVLDFHVICSSDFARKKMLKNIPVLRRNLIKIIPFGIKLHQTDEVSETNDEINIGFAGRLVRQKRIHKIFEALKFVNYKINFFLAGEGELKEELVLISNNLKESNVNVVFLGNVSDMIDFYLKLDVLILPSKHESYGLVVLEALSRNVPVIVFKDTGACVEFIDNNINGYVVKDVDELGVIINKLKSKQLRIQLKNNVRTSDLSIYDITKTKTELDNLKQII